MHRGAVCALWQFGSSGKFWDAVSQQSSNCSMLDLEMLMSRKRRKQIGSAAPVACAARSVHQAHPYVAMDTGLLNTYLLCVQDVPSGSDWRRDVQLGPAGAQRGPSELDSCTGCSAGAGEAAAACLFRRLGGQHKVQRGDQQWRRRSQRQLVTQSWVQCGNVGSLE